MASHRLGRETFHYKWDSAHKPVLTIRSGDIVTFDVNDVLSWQLTEKSTSSDLKKLDNEKLYPLAGPVYVEGAEPGDALVLDILDVKVDDFGWTAILPGLGLLEEFKRPFLYKWNLGGKRHVHFKRGIRIPIRPFCGVLGVAPAEGGSFEVMPPGRHGGNMDIRHTTAGSRVRIPVQVEGALFSTGDIHAAMGDGEICVCAIECAGSAKIRFGLEKKAGLSYPDFRSRRERISSAGWYTTTGIASDLMTAAKESARGMIDHLTRTYGLSKEEAYVLCSVAADLRIHEVVDSPNWVVGTMIPLDIFPNNPDKGL
ncbi:MAG: acetamidase/formamidase family protein [Nitrososphaerota archaeon]|nr:acetamidase/formamidase family protein [Nitrososphaerota archaeon]MDG6918236.1 acetamidase/formamidase family protein [Nitrososphaerota archaeon]